MGALIRSTDWGSTPLGPVASWSASLRAMVGILLANRFPLLLWWGPDLVQLYNDPYRPVLGSKHPRSMGQPARECWPEIWHIIGPLIMTPYRGGPATWMDDLFLEPNRHGFVEETHFTVAYSPVPDETAAAGIGGVLATVHEITQQVVQQRRVVVLRDLGARAMEAKTAEEACGIAARTFTQHAKDVPFALIYLLDADAPTARLAAAAGVDRGGPASPSVVDLRATGEPERGWPLAEALGKEQPILVDDLAERFSTVPPGPWSDPPRQALVVPIPSNIQHQFAGVLVLGASVRLELDDLYRSFFDLTTAQVATAIANTRAYEEQRKRAEALAEIDRAKTLFFSNVSHEFRTPLTLMLGPLEDVLAVEVGMTAAGREQVSVVHRNGLRLLKLVNTLLDFARIEAGRADAAFEAVDLAAFTVELASVVRSAVERAGLRLAVDCPPLPEPVYVDREMWEKIVLNLLSNAFKFTFEGHIAVSIQAIDDRAEMVVRDTGIGIAAEELPLIFERFHRVRGARSRTHEGTGIGLSLIQELVRLHGGTVAVTSELGVGTTFTVAIPLGTAHLPADRVGAAHTLASTALGAAPYVEEALRWLPDDIAEESGPGVGAGVSTSGARVLLADDNADMRDYLRRLLSQHWTVEAVADGAAALAAARARCPDLVLTDVMMPGLDGVELLRALRDDPLTRTVPVILLSARAGEESRVEGLEQGADDYLIKPFSARELVARVNAHLEMARVRREALDRQEAARDAAEAANRAKDEFLAMLSHELRTPLTSVMGWVRMLRTGQVPEADMPRVLEVVDRNVKLQVRLIDDLLDLSGILAGRLTVALASVELGSLVTAAVQAFRQEAEAGDVRLQADIVDVSLRLEGDATRLHQVVVNLVTNALAFTPAGGQVTVRVRRTDTAALISVADTGEGIPDDVLPHIFERFWQRDSPSKRRAGRLGLGLAIVRHIVELHHGSVRAESAGPGRGAVFTVALPLTAGAPARAAFDRVEGGVAAR